MASSTGIAIKRFLTPNLSAENKKNKNFSINSNPRSQCRRKITSLSKIQKKKRIEILRHIQTNIKWAIFEEKSHQKHLDNSAIEEIEIWEGVGGDELKGGLGNLGEVRWKVMEIDMILELFTKLPFEPGFCLDLTQRCYHDSWCAQILFDTFVESCENYK